LSNTLFIKAEEIAAEMGVSKPYAYKLVRRLNAELEKAGFITVSGRVSREYYREKIYAGTTQEKGVQHGSFQR
jgi:Mn-dependent DtxR family transcriptional regulator